MYTTISMIQRYAVPPALHSFPTRRSSDLLQPLREHRPEPDRRPAERRAQPAEPAVGDPAEQPHRRHHTAAAAEHSRQDRKSTRLNSSHRCISYAVFCLKKKKKYNDKRETQ